MLLQSSSLAAVLLSSMVLVGYLAPVTEAHSWVECCNWQFNNPDVQDWSEKGGTCQGYARRFPLGHAFASMDSNPSRHYQQDHNDPDNAPPCSDGHSGKEKGMDETLAEPRDAAYGQQNGKKYGEITVTKVGDQLCLRWPAKTHGNENSMVVISLSKNVNGKDPSQKGFISNEVARLPFKNCSGDRSKDATPCGGCFTVPVRASGDYVLQWRWELNHNEFYTSCADIRIGSK